MPLKIHWNPSLNSMHPNETLIRSQLAAIVAAALEISTSKCQ